MLRKKRNRLTRIRRKRTTCLFVFALSAITFGQVADGANLYQAIKEKDSLLFQIGFNTCNIRQFENLVSEHFEFYHDQSGITPSKQAFISGIQNHLCKLPYQPKRVLAENTLEVYPLKKNNVVYGAIQTGVHHFYAVTNNKFDYLTSTAKFTHVWELENGDWKLTKGLSYDHKDVAKPLEKELLFIDKQVTEEWLKQKQIPALGIGFIRDGKMEQVSVFGELSPGNPAPLTTIWNVASLTKQIGRAHV